MLVDSRFPLAVLTGKENKKLIMFSFPAKYVCIQLPTKQICPWIYIKIKYVYTIHP